MERLKVDVIGNLNEYAFIQGSETTQKQVQKPKAEARVNPKFDWYQNMTHVFISFKIEGGDKDLSKNTKVTFEKQSILM